MKKPYETPIFDLCQINTNADILTGSKDIIEPGINLDDLFVQ